jgi:hypothetical protein
MARMTQAGGALKEALKYMTKVGRFSTRGKSGPWLLKGRENGKCMEVWIENIGFGIWIFFGESQKMIVIEHGDLNGIKAQP